MILFQPSASEVHAQAGKWFDDEEIYGWFAGNLHRVREPSLRHYVRAKELKAAGMDWTAVLAEEVENRRARLAAELLASPAYDSTAAHVKAFVQQGGGCRATFFNYRRRLQGEGRPRKALRSLGRRASAMRDGTRFIDMLKTPHSWYDRAMEPTVTQDQTGQNEPTSGPPLDRPRIVSTPGTCGGKPRIEGHRITVKHIVLDYQREGMSPDEIVSAYPTLTLSDVHAALAHYYDHQTEIDANIKEDDDHWAEIQRQNPGRLIDRLRQRKANAPDHTIPPG